MNADVIVIGAGIVGSACAKTLAQRGMNVLVLDSQRGGATAAGMGHLVAMDDNPAELALSRYSIELWQQWAPQLAADCAYRNCGTLWLAANQEELQAAAHKGETLRAQGVACQLLDAEGLRQTEPMLRRDLSGALKVSGDSIVYAPNAARWMLTQGGTRIRQRCEQVSAVEGNRVRLADGSWLQAKLVIMANGIHASGLCPELPIRPKKGHILITDRYPGRIQHQLVELGYAASAHVTSGTTVAFNAQPRPTGQILLGSSRQFDSLSPEVEGAVLARMLQRALDYLPELGQLSAIRSWTGFRAATPDGLPLIGAHPQQPGLWLAVGHEGLGVTTAPGTAQLLAEQLLGEPSAIDPAPYRPERFLHTPELKEPHR